MHMIYLLVETFVAVQCRYIFIKYVLRGIKYKAYNIFRKEALCSWMPTCIALWDSETNIEWNFFPLEIRQNSRCSSVRKIQRKEMKNHVKEIQQMWTVSCFCSSIAVCSFPCRYSRKVNLRMSSKNPPPLNPWFIVHV